MVNKNKIYKFSYGNILKKSVSCILDILSVFSCAFFVICLWLLAELFIQNISNEKLSYILTVLLSVISAFLEIFIIVISLLPRKIIMTEDKIRIIKNCVQKNYIIPSIFDDVFYFDIKSCELYDGPMSLLGWNLSYLLLDDKNMVEIVLKSNKRYHFPVKNAEEFIEDVNKRIIEFSDKGMG